MSDRQKIHVFLGAPPPPPPPPPSSVPASVCEAGVEERPSAGWRHLELCWQDGQLRRRADELGSQVRSSEDDRTKAAQEDQNAEVSKGRGRVESHHSSTAEREGFCVDTHTQRCEDEEEVCSASIHEYLDGCFPAAQPEQNHHNIQELPPDPSPAVPHTSTSLQTQYLTTWTLSQVLVLRGKHGIQSATLPPLTQPTNQTPSPVSSITPELFSPATPTQSPSVNQSESAELSGQPILTPRGEEGGVILEAITDGILCSQGAQQQEQVHIETKASTTAHKSPSRSPSPKRARVPEGFSRMEASWQQSDRGLVGLGGPTTLLVRCNRAGVRYSVLVAVVHPCHLKEIKVKSGGSAGTFVPLASVVVTDQSGVEMKVVLWRRMAFWVLTVSPGDILLITGLEVNEDKWRGETVLQSTYTSKLLNLGQITTSSSPAVPQHVSARSLSSLCGFLRERRPLLVSLPRPVPQNLSRLPYVSLRSLRVNMLVHALLRVTHMLISKAWRSEAESRCRSAVLPKAVLDVEQPDGQQGALVLWGAALDWLPRFSHDRAAVWDFRFLLVREGLTSDLLELHSTSWSSVQTLDPADRRAQDFLTPPQPIQMSDKSLELDLETLLSQKYSGDIELRVHVITFQFQDAPPSQNAPQQVLDSSSAPDEVLAVLNGDITYTGCGRCATELHTDANGIYKPCYPCLPHTAARRYYRPAVLTVSGRGSQVRVQVPPVLLQKILDAPPDKLHRISAPGVEVKFMHVAAERIQTLLSLPRKTFTITVHSRFLCDENSVAIVQDFTLLDLQFS